jgi:hypothetical protein
MGAGQQYGTLIEADNVDTICRADVLAVQQHILLFLAHFFISNENKRNADTADIACQAAQRGVLVRNIGCTATNGFRVSRRHASARLLGPG